MLKKLIVVIMSVMVLTTVEIPLKKRDFNASDKAIGILGGMPLGKATAHAIGLGSNNMGKSCEHSLNRTGLRIVLEVTNESSEKKEKELQNENIEIYKESVEKEIINKKSGEKDIIKKESNIAKESGTVSQHQKPAEKETIEEKQEVQEVVKEPVPTTEKEISSPEKTIKDLPSKHTITYRSDIEEEVLALVNKLRLDNGLAPFTTMGLLKESSRYKSNSMIQLGYFGHYNPNYNNENSGYLILKVFKVSSSKVGENIAMYTDRREERINGKGLFDLWYNSEPHRKAMLSDSYTKIGIGVVTTFDSDGRIKIYGTQHFAK